MCDRTIHFDRDQAKAWKREREWDQSGDKKDNGTGNKDQDQLWSGPGLGPGPGPSPVDWSRSQSFLVPMAGPGPSGLVIKMLTFWQKDAQQVFKDTQKNTPYLNYDIYRFIFV